MTQEVNGVQILHTLGLHFVSLVRNCPSPAHKLVNLNYFGGFGKQILC
jgi:hypothetical protein